MGNIMFEGINFTDGRERAEKFNEYFVESAEKIVRGGEVDLNMEIEAVVGGNFLSVLPEVSMEELTLIVSQMRKKGGSDGINVKNYKSVWNSIGKFVNRWINETFKERIVVKSIKDFNSDTSDKDYQYSYGRGVLVN